MYSYGGFQNFNMALKKRVWAMGPPGETVDAVVVGAFLRARARHLGWNLSSIETSLHIRPPFLDDDFLKTNHMCS